MGGVIVEQEADQPSRQVMRIEPLKEGNELARAMSLGYDVMHEAAHEVDRSGQGECPEQGVPSRLYS